MTLIGSAALLDALGRYQLGRVLAALPDKGLHQSVGAFGVILQQLARNLDEAPVRLARLIADMEDLLAHYGQMSGTTLPVLEAQWHRGTLSGMEQRRDELAAALIEMNQAIAQEQSPQFADLRQRVLKAYLAWTSPDLPNADGELP